MSISRKLRIHNVLYNRPQNKPWRHNTKHNDTKNNDTVHNRLLNATNTEVRLHIFFTVMRSVIVLSVARHSVMAPLKQCFELAERDQRSSLFVRTFIDEDLNRFITSAPARWDGLVYGGRNFLCCDAVDADDVGDAAVVVIDGDVRLDEV
jgi:hypothetical protein